MQIAVLGGELVAKVGIYEAWQLPLTLLALPTAALITKYPIGVFAEFEYLVSRISNRPYLSAALIAAAATCARLALSPFLGVPEPVVPDEVSLIFQAKTYLTGHFANHVNLLPNFQPLLRQYHTYIRVDLPGPSIVPDVHRPFPGHWGMGWRSSLDGCADCGGLLDGPGMDERQICFYRGFHCHHTIRTIQPLGERLLGRSVYCTWRGPVVGGLQGSQIASKSVQRRCGRLWGSSS